MVSVNTDEVMKSLQQIWSDLAAAGYETDKGSVHSYIPVYQGMLEDYRHKAKNVLEIGLFNGHSIRMWKEYFTNADIHGVDCDERPHGGMADLRPMINEGWNIHIMDATDHAAVELLFRWKRFDVIIDDAGHHIDQQLYLREVFRNFVARGGIYIIEDIQDIDRTGSMFEEIGGEVIDLRSIKKRYDDVLVIFKQ